jgi:hypothetical protein
MSTEREREKKRNRIVVFLITCKFLIPDESTRKNKSLTMNWIDRDQQQIQLGFLIIHACNSIINIKKNRRTTYHIDSYLHVFCGLIY